MSDWRVWYRLLAIYRKCVLKHYLKDTADCECGYIYPAPNMEWIERSYPTYQYKRSE